MRVACGIYVCSAAMMVVCARAADNQMGLEYSRNVDSRFELSADQKPVFWDHLESSFDQQVADNFADQFHPLNVMNWNIKFDDTGYGWFRDRSANVAQSTLGKSLVYSLREAAVYLPVMSWLNEHRKYLADFLWNSVDSVQEEAVSPLDPSYGLVERSWWENLSENQPVRVGIRPLRSDPYAFLGFRVQDGDRLYLLGNVRYHFRNFSEHNFELAFSVPLAHRMAVDVGTSYALGQGEQQKRLVVKFYKELKTGGILHCGVEAQQRPAFFAGMALPW